VNAGDPISISSSLDGVIRSLRGPGRRQVSGVFGRWEEAVGAQVAAHVQPIKLDDGVLVVEVDDSAWATHVKFLSGTIMERLAEIAEVRIDRVEIRVSQSSGTDRRGSRGREMFSD
jgi:Dna[CI] antecedent, DciA